MKARNNNILLASITSAYNHARANDKARFTLRVPANSRELHVDLNEVAYFTRTNGEVVKTGLTLSQLESEYLKYDLRGIQLFLEQ